MGADVNAARTFLFVPGDRPERFAKAAASGADLVILDLEDAVGPERKPAARDHVGAWLADCVPCVVRVNAAGTPWHDDDMAMVALHPGPVAAVMVPKAEEPKALEALAIDLPPSIALIPLIETAAGILSAAALCAVPRVARPAFGSVDLAAQLGVDHRSHAALHHARSVLVLAAAAARCAGPVDGVTTSLADDTALRADLGHAAELGFTGKLCIHPRQVPVANERLAPSADDVAWARDVVAKAVSAKGADGSVTVGADGQMIDRPVVLRAQAILARAGG